jgi:hypothetical protein
MRIALASCLNGSLAAGLYVFWGDMMVNEVVDVRRMEDCGKRLGRFFYFQVQHEDNCFF